MKFIEIYKAMNEETESLQFSEKTAIIVDTDTLKLHRIFVKKGEEYKEINLNAAIKKIVDFLKDKVDVAGLLSEYFKSQSNVEEIVELSARIDKKPSVKTGKCFSLKIGGKVGKPYELILIRNRGYDE